MWTIRAPVNFKLRFDFSFFDVEYSRNCKNDFIAIYDGPNEKHPLIDSFCGSAIPPTVQSKRNVISLRMRTNRNKNGAGFVVYYKRLVVDTTIATKGPKHVTRKPSTVKIMSAVVTKPTEAITTTTSAPRRIKTDFSTRKPLTKTTTSTTGYFLFQ